MSSPSYERPLRAHQLVHGYKGGHRLLAGSTSLPPDVLRLVDRLSDAAGMQLSKDRDGYLTGYPLPGGDYALARTWPAPEAERPNVVWTHTLVLPSAALSAVSMQPLATLFSRPRSRSDLAQYASPLPLNYLANRPPTPIRGGKTVERVVASLYWGEPGAWLPGGPSPDDLCLAIWSQQWPRLRRAFAFCSGALEPRRLDGKDFDLLLAPEGHRAGSLSKQPSPVASEAAHALIQDLAHPGPLRDFLRTCGSDSGQLRSLPMFTTTWLNARRAKDPVDVLAAVADQAPEPTSLRRLKRELLRGPNALLARSDPTLTLRSLTGDTGHRILAEDADVDAWLDRAWKANRRAVLSLAAQGSAAPELQPGAGTAAEAAQFAAITLVLDRSIPSDLPLLAREAPDLAARSLSRHTGIEWWDAWATLPHMDGALATVATADAQLARSACNALLRQEDGTRLWSTLHRNNSAIAIRGLLAAVADTGQPMTSKWAAKLGPHGKEMVIEIHQGLPWKMLAAAADVAPYAADVARIPLHLWQPLAEHRQLWEGNPTRAAVLLTAALGTVGPTADELAADTFLVLHRAFSEGRADEAWRVIKPAIPGRLDDWDRCRRLEQGLAAVIVGDKRQQPRPGIRNRVPPGRARDALDAAVRSASAGVGKKNKPKGPLDDLFGFLRR